MQRHHMEQVLLNLPSGDWCGGERGLAAVQALFARVEASTGCLDVPYTTTKHAITGLTKSLSLDAGHHDIACGQIDIGNAAKEMTANIQRGVPQVDGSMAAEPVMPVDFVVFIRVIDRSYGLQDQTSHWDTYI